MPTFITVRNPDTGELTLIQIPDGSAPVIPTQPGQPGPDPSPASCSDNPINTICGFSAGTQITTGTNDTLFGVSAGSLLMTEGNNSFFGHNSGRIVSGGVGNTLLGSGSATGLKTGSQNVVVGNGSGLNFTGVESRNLILYSPAQANDSATIRIGEQGIHESKTFIKGIHSTLQTGGSILNVTVDVNGHMGTDAGGGSLIGLTNDANTLLGINSSSFTSADSNVILGFEAADFATTMGEAVIIGRSACQNALNQGRGTFIGANCGLNTSVTSGTIAIGFNSLQNQTGGAGNVVCVGHEAMQDAISCDGSTCIGALTGKKLTTGVLNTCVGRFAGTNLREGDSNCLIGAGAGTGIGLGELTTGHGDSNTACGTNSLFILGGSSGGDNFNTALGRSSGSLVTGSSNLYLGHLSGSGHGDPAGENNNICIMNAGVSAEQNTIHIGLATHTNTFLAGVGGNTPSGTPVAVIIDPVTGELGAGQVQMNGSGDMSMVNSMDINGTGQILLQTSLAGADAIKLNATGSSSGVNIDATGQIDIATSLANTQALKLVCSAVAGGLNMNTGLGGITATTTGGYDFHSSINMAGEGVKLRATGTQGTITLDAQTGGVVITNSDVNGLVFDDSTSLFNATMKASPLMTASYNMVLPIAQAAVDGMSLVNNSSGTLRWDFGIAAFPNGWINGLGLNNGTTPDTDKDIVVGECRDDTDVFNIVVGSTLTVDNTTTGADGLDTGSLSSDQWYTIWVIADTSLVNPIASLMSESETSPTLPSGYDVKRRVGWARTDSTSDFYKAFYGQSDQSRVVLWDVAETLLEVLTDGSATVYTVVDCSEFIPPVTGGLAGYVNMNHFGSQAQDFITVAPTNLVPDLDGLSPVTNPRANRCFGGSSAGGGQAGSTFSFITFSDDAGEILYANSSGTEDSDIWIIGYVDTLKV